MSTWGRALYGDPCHQCGFAWSTDPADAIALVSELPGSYQATLVGASGRERHPELIWPVVSYVCHVADNLRIWAERLIGAARGGPSMVARYDESQLAESRHYDAIPLPAALWALDRAAADWQTAVAEATAAAVVLVHPDRGEQTVADVIRSNAHDGYHHQWDIARSLAATADR